LNPDLADVPVDLLRILVVSVEAGDDRVAARCLDLPLAAIDAELRRLERMLGFELFSETGPPRRLSQPGGTILHYARRMISVNDELVRQTAVPGPGRKFSIGLPHWVPHNDLIEVVGRCTAIEDAATLSFRCDEIETLMQDLYSGRLDVAFLCTTPKGPCVPIASWTESRHWIKARGTELHPGESVRLVSWPGGGSDRLATRLLEAAGIRYSIAFSARPTSTRVAAVAAGLGLLIANERVLTPDVCVAREPHLPKPPPISTGVYAREGLDTGRYGPLLGTLTECVAPRGLPAEHVA
jgi:DNA-binding transcriptional LysR family regulator